MSQKLDSSAKLHHAERRATEGDLNFFEFDFGDFKDRDEFWLKNLGEPIEGFSVN